MHPCTVPWPCSGAEITPCWGIWGAVNGGALHSRLLFDALLSREGLMERNSPKVSQREGSISISTPKIAARTASGVRASGSPGVGMQQSPTRGAGGGDVLGTIPIASHSPWIALLPIFPLSSQFFPFAPNFSLPLSHFPLRPPGSKESLFSSTITASEEAMTVLEEVIMYTFQQCVYYISKVGTPREGSSSPWAP